MRKLYLIVLAAAFLTGCFTTPSLSTLRAPATGCASMPIWFPIVDVCRSPSMRPPMRTSAENSDLLNRLLFDPPEAVETRDAFRPDQPQQQRSAGAVKG